MRKSKSILDLFDRQDTNRIVMIASSRIRPSRYQPRLRFDEEALEELAASIKENGLIQPITVRKMGDQYEIIGVEDEFVTEIAGYKLIGYVDLILRDKNTGEITIVDHKSKSVKRLQQDWDELVLQLYIYAHYVHEKYGEWPKFLVFNCFREAQMVGEEFNPEEYERMVKWVETTITEILNATEFPDKIAKDANERIAKGKRPLKDNTYFCKTLCDCWDACPIWQTEDLRM